MLARHRVTAGLAVVLLAAACNTVLGIHELASTPGGDGGPDGPTASDGGRDATSDGRNGGANDGGPDGSAEDADAAPCTGHIAVVGAAPPNLAFALTIDASGSQSALATWTNLMLDNAAPSVVALPGGTFEALFLSNYNGGQYFYATTAGGVWGMPISLNMAAESSATLLATSSTLYALFIGTNQYFGMAQYPLDAGADAADGASPVWVASPSPNIGAGSAPPAAFVFQDALLAVFPSTQYGAPITEKLFVPATSAWGDNSTLAQPTNGFASLAPLPGPNLALMVYGTSSLVLEYLTMDQGGTWSAPLGVAATSAASDAASDAPSGQYSNLPTSLLPLSGGRALLLYAALNPSPNTPVNVLWTIFDGKATWTTPQALVTTAPLTAVPAIAAGLCGDDAVAVIPPSATGNAELYRFRGNTWSSLATIPNSFTTSTGASYAAIATTP